MGDKIKPHPSDCATCAPGSPALLHAASNAAAERAAAERERVAFLRAKCADLAWLAGFRNAQGTQHNPAQQSQGDPQQGADGQLLQDVTQTECQDELQAARARLAEVERERDAARADLYETREGLRKLQKERDEADAALAREKVLHKWAVDKYGELFARTSAELTKCHEERDEARAKLSEVQRELAEARAAARAAVYEARVGWRVSERLRGQAEGEVARLRCFAEGLAQGLSVPAAGASSGLCRVCLTARPPLAEVATVTTRGASGEVLHFCDECWGLTAARHSGVAR